MENNPVETKNPYAFKRSLISICIEVLLLATIAFSAFSLGVSYSNASAAKKLASWKAGTYRVENGWEKDGKLFYQLEELTTMAKPTDKHIPFRYCDPNRIGLQENLIINLVLKDEAFKDGSDAATDADCYLAVVPYK